MPATIEVDLVIPTPRAFLPLLAPNKRYRGAHGGRGSGKSWFFAELMVDRFVEDPTLRAVCVREFQTSLKHSSKQLLVDTIARLGVNKDGKRFRILDTRIETPQGGFILFQGMANHTADSFKSLERVKIAWFEEAQRCSRRSLTILTPTIRDAGAELWFSWNPDSPENPVDQLLRGDDVPADAAVVEANWNDNPWFPAELRKELERDRARDPEKYAHVWCGAYGSRSEARVFKNWGIREFEAPADAVFYLGADWGYSVDPSVLVRCHVIDRTLFVDYEAYEVGVEIDRLPTLFSRVPGAREWPIVADSARPETISYLQRHGFPSMSAARKGPNSVEEGVQFLQNYDIVVHPRCEATIREMTDYAFKVDPLTQRVTPKLNDKDNHVIDSLRYAVEALRKPEVDNWVI